MSNTLTFTQGQREFHTDFWCTFGISNKVMFILEQSAWMKANEQQPPPDEMSASVHFWIDDRCATVQWMCCQKVCIVAAFLLRHEQGDKKIHKANVRGILSNM